MKMKRGDKERIAKMFPGRSRVEEGERVEEVNRKRGRELRKRKREREGERGREEGGVRKDGKEWWKDGWSNSTHDSSRPYSQVLLFVLVPEIVGWSTPAARTFAG
jgi:hypothetical protein